MGAELCGWTGREPVICGQSKCHGLRSPYFPEQMIRSVSQSVKLKTCKKALILPPVQRQIVLSSAEFMPGYNIKHA